MKDGIINSVYIRVAITYFDHGLAPYARLGQISNDEHRVNDDLPLAQAQKLMWELVKAGGERVYESNPYAPHIHTVEVTYYMAWED